MTAAGCLDTFLASDDESQLLDTANSSTNFHLLSATSKPLHSRVSHRRVLPMAIMSKLHSAVPDTGSIDNVVSEDFARSLGATLSVRTVPEQYHNACGKAFDSRWTTSLPCAFPDEPDSERICEFSVVTGLAVPLIMGSKFLEVTKTLTKFKNRLVRVANKALTGWRLLHVQIPRRQLRCTLDNETTSANADTGSNVDLVSIEYAQRRKWDIVDVPNNMRMVELADGTLQQLAGKVRCRFSAGGTSPKTTRKKTFYVLAGLTSDVLLGDDTLEEIDAFETYKDDFVDIEADFNPIDLIYWIGNEGWPSMETLLEEAHLGSGSSVTLSAQNPMPRRKSRFGFRNKRKTWNASEILSYEPLYERYMETMANWNERQKDDFDKKILKLTGQAKIYAEQSEQLRCQEYEELRGKVQVLHEQRRPASQT